MNKQIRSAIRKQMKYRHLSQASLGNLIDMSQPNVARALAGRSGTIPDTWTRMLEAVGLELVAIPKGTDVSKLLAEKER